MLLLLLEQIKVEKNKNNLCIYVSLTFRKPQERQTEFGLRRTTSRVWLMKSWRFSFRSMESIQDQLLVSITVFSNVLFVKVWVVFSYAWFCISASTRQLYEKKLQHLLEHPPLENTLPEPETTIPEAVTIKADGNQNGNTHSAEDQYSDKEEGKAGIIVVVLLLYYAIRVCVWHKHLVKHTLIFACLCIWLAEVDPVPEPVPVVTKPVRSRGKTPVTTRTSSRQRAKVKQIQIASQ